MIENETALQLTLKALEGNKIQFEKHASDGSERMEKRNNFNAKQLADFFNNLSERLNISK